MGVTVQVLFTLFSRIGFTPNSHVCSDPLGAKMRQERDAFLVGGCLIESADRKCFPLSFGDDSMERVDIIGFSSSWGEWRYKSIIVCSFLGFL